MLLVSLHIQSDSKLLSGFQFIQHTNPDNNLESLCTLLVGSIRFLERGIGQAVSECRDSNTSAFLRHSRWTKWHWSKFLVHFLEFLTASLHSSIFSCPFISVF
jgi:hypothetical protein